MWCCSRHIQEDKPTVGTLRKSPRTTYEWHLHKNRDVEVGQMLTPPQMSHQSRVNSSHQLLKAFPLRDPPVWRCGEMIRVGNEVWRAHLRTHEWCMSTRQDNPSVKIRWSAMSTFPSVTGKSAFELISAQQCTFQILFSDNSNITWEMNYTWKTIFNSTSLPKKKNKKPPNQTVISDTPPTNKMQKQKLLAEAHTVHLSSSLNFSWNISTHKQK